MRRRDAPKLWMRSIWTLKQLECGNPGRIRYGSGNNYDFSSLKSSVLHVCVFYFYYFILFFFIITIFNIIIILIFIIIIIIIIFIIISFFLFF